MARRRADWSELYQELLISITGRLDTRDDVRHLRAVCKKWRLGIPQIPPNLPFLSTLFPHEISITSPAYSASEDFFYESPSGNSVFIVANTTFLIRPNETQNPNPIKPWLITVEELNPGKFYLRKPLTRFVIENFPDNFPRVVDLSDFSVREISKAYNFSYVEKSPVDVVSKPRYWRRFKNKVVLFFNPDSVCPTIDDCYALVLRNCRSLLCMRLKDEEEHAYLRYKRVSSFDDIVTYKGCVWAIDRLGRIYVVHYSNALKLVMFSSDPVVKYYLGATRKRLVESSDGLYLIDKVVGYEDALIQFRVYKLNEGERKWNRVKSLDGRILFVSTDCCYFLSAEDFPRCEGNCIFFPKHHFPAYDDTIYPDDCYFKGASWELEIGVFHLDNGESALVSAYPNYSDIFWPPPRWLFSNTCSSTCVEEEDEDHDPEVCCSQVKSPSSLAIDAKPQNPCAIEVQDEYMAVDVSWCDIPSKLLSEIAKHLKTRIDVFRSRAVCKKWKASIPPPLTSNILCSLLPHKISTTTAPFLDTFRHSGSSHAFVLVASIVYLLHPCEQSLGGIPAKSWFLTVEELNPGKLSLLLPLRRVAMKELPENFPRVLNLSNFHVSEIGKEYYFRDAKRRWDESTYYGLSFASSNKVVLFSDSDCTSPTVDDTTAMVLCDSGLVSFRLRDEHCSIVRYGAITKFDDIVYFKGKIYAVDRKGRAYITSCNTSKIFRIVGDAIGTGGSGRDREKRLVKSNGELYLLVRHSPHDIIYFRVYKLNEEQHKWDEVDSLGDRILFVTPSFCFLASSRDFPGWKCDCIVFPSHCLPTYSGKTDPDWKFFKGTTKELEIGVFRLGNNDAARLIKFYSGYSNLFWPPPAWLQPRGCLSRNQQAQTNFPCKHSSKYTPLDTKFLAQSDLTSTITSPLQASSSGASIIRFQGVDVRSELVPILEKIWAKYGNIAEGSMEHSSGSIASALESLAEAVLILKSTPGRSLDISQLDNLRDTLSNLQFLQFKVDWLVQAFECQLSKTLVNQLRELERLKAELPEMNRIQLKSLERLAEVESKIDVSMNADAQEMRKEILNMTCRLAEQESKVDEETRKTIDRINVIGPIDMEKILEGLC